MAFWHDSKFPSKAKWVNFYFRCRNGTTGIFGLKLCESFWSFLFYAEENLNNLEIKFEYCTDTLFLNTEATETTYTPMLKKLKHLVRMLIAHIQLNILIFFVCSFKFHLDPGKIEAWNLECRTKNKIAWAWLC